MESGRSPWNSVDLASNPISMEVLAGSMKVMAVCHQLAWVEVMFIHFNDTCHASTALRESAYHLNRKHAILMSYGRIEASMEVASSSFREHP